MVCEGRRGAGRAPPKMPCQRQPGVPVDGNSIAANVRKPFHAANCRASTINRIICLACARVAFISDMWPLWATVNGLEHLGRRKRWFPFGSLPNLPHCGLQLRQVIFSVAFWAGRPKMRLRFGISAAPRCGIWPRFRLPPWRSLLLPANDYACIAGISR